MVLERWPLAPAYDGATRERSPNGRGWCPASPQLQGDWHDAARSGGRTHQAQDIFAPRGWPVVAPVAGRVIAVGTGRLGGNYIQLRGNAGQRVYLAHLDAPADFEVGERVELGEVLGRVGNTGSGAIRTCPHLHIQVRNAAGDYINVYETLRALERLAQNPDTRRGAPPRGGPALSHERRNPAPSGGGGGFVLLALLGAALLLGLDTRSPRGA